MENHDKLTTSCTATYFLPQNNRKEQVKHLTEAMLEKRSIYFKDLAAYDRDNQPEDCACMLYTCQLHENCQLEDTVKKIGDLYIGPDFSEKVRLILTDLLTAKAKALRGEIWRIAGIMWRPVRKSQMSIEAYENALGYNEALRDILAFLEAEPQSR